MWAVSWPGTKQPIFCPRPLFATFSQPVNRFFPISGQVFPLYFKPWVWRTRMGTRKPYEDGYEEGTACFLCKLRPPHIIVRPDYSPVIRPVISPRDPSLPPLSLPIGTQSKKKKDRSRCIYVRGDRFKGCHWEGHGEGGSRFTQGTIPTHPCTILVPILVPFLVRRLRP